LAARSRAGGPQEPPLPLQGPAARYDHHAGNDDYAQAGALFRLMSEDQKAQLVANLAAAA
jgi:catalase